MLEVIKKAAVDAVEASKPCVVMYGTVTRLSPLNVRIEQRLTVDASIIIKPKHITLSTNDKVVLVREQGGQKFIVLGVI